MNVKDVIAAIGVIGTLLGLSVGLDHMLDAPMRKTIDDINSNMKTVKNQIGGMEKIQKDITEVQADIAKAQSNIAKAQADIAEVQIDIAKVQANITANQNNINIMLTKLIPSPNSGGIRWINPPNSNPIDIPGFNFPNPNPINIPGINSPREEFVSGNPPPPENSERRIFKEEEG